MNTETFIHDFKLAFGENVKLPIAFWYSGEAFEEAHKINGCMFKFLKDAHDGINITLSRETITCGGGKFYTGFAEMPERVPKFVSLTERYKQIPEMVTDFLDKINIPRTDKTYLNFARIDKIKSFENIEGVFFMANPDVLSGLITWAYFDNNDESSVSTIFGSACATIITYTAIENQANGRRTFLGGFDPSARPYFEENELSFAIPMSRFNEMYNTMHQSCLFDTHAWKKVKERIMNE